MLKYIYFLICYTIVFTSSSLYFWISLPFTYILHKNCLHSFQLGLSTTERSGTTLNMFKGSKPYSLASNKPRHKGRWHLRAPKAFSYENEGCARQKTKNKSLNPNWAWLTLYVICLSLCPSLRTTLNDKVKSNDGTFG